MYIDLDLHHGDGVVSAFANTLRSRHIFPQVLTLSIHHTAPGFYPAGPLADTTPVDTSDPFTLSIPLKAGASAATFAQIWVAVEKIRTSFAPEYVIVQCGVDGLAGDPCAKWNWCLDRQSEGSLGWCVERILQWNCGTLLLGGGMYIRYLWSPKAAGCIVLSRTSRRVQFSECSKSMELFDIHSSEFGISLRTPCFAIDHTSRAALQYQPICPFRNTRSGHCTHPHLPWMFLLGICLMRTPPNIWSLSTCLLRRSQAASETGRPLHDSLGP